METLFASHWVLDPGSVSVGLHLGHIEVPVLIVGFLVLVGEDGDEQYGAHLNECGVADKPDATPVGGPVEPDPV